MVEYMVPLCIQVMHSSYADAANQCKQPSAGKVDGLIVIQHLWSARQRLYLAPYTRQDKTSQVPHPANPFSSRLIVCIRISMHAYATMSHADCQACGRS